MVAAYGRMGPRRQQEIATCNKVNHGVRWMPCLTGRAPGLTQCPAWTRNRAITRSVSDAERVARRIQIMAKKSTAKNQVKLRSRQWFDNPDNPGHDRALPRALHELRADARGAAGRQAHHRHRAVGLGPVALQPPSPSSSPIACAKAFREAGGIAFEFPVHPIQETGKRPTRSARPQPLRTSGWSRFSTATSSTASCSPRAATRPRPRS